MSNKFNPLEHIPPFRGKHTKEKEPRETYFQVHSPNSGGDFHTFPAEIQALSHW